MVLETLTLLVAEPVHEQTIVEVDGGNSDQHIAGDAEGGNARQKSQDQSQAAKEFGGNC